MRRNFISAGDAASGPRMPIASARCAGPARRSTRGERLAACLLRVLLWLCLVPCASAAPRLWIEARLDPPSVPVNVQSTLIVRFGHAVDVRSPRFDAPPVRLAELVPLGPVVVSETSRDGVRYRVLERRFAVLPFASGDLPLAATVSGTTPAALPEAGGRASFTLASPALRLTVSPATVSAGWLPAHDLQFSADNATPGGLRVGEVWTRNLLIEAVGVDGSVIIPPIWPATSGWSLQFDPPQVGRRVDGGRVVGYRRQTVHAQALQPGRQSFPVPRLGWWQVATGQWRDSAPSAASVEVEASAANSGSDAGRRDKVGILESAQPDRSVPGKSAGREGGWWAGMALLLIAAGVLRWRSGHRTLRLAWQRHRRWRALARACRNNDAPAARQALQAWGAGSGLPARLLAADATGHPAPLANALAALDAACFGPHGGGWNGQELRRALPSAFTPAFAALKMPVSALRCALACAVARFR